MRPLRLWVGAALLAGAAAASSGDVVVLKGGTVIPLKQPVVRRGNTAYLTRADGTLLSVPVSEIDRDATAAANRAATAPAAPKAEPAATNPADAARSVAKDGQKARVRITDADVSHPLDLGNPEDKDKDKEAKEAASGAPRVEVADYTREKNEGNLVVKGSLRNPGQGTAENVRLNVAAMDEKGKPIDSATATLSKGAVESGTTVEFVATINVGDKNAASLKFSPQWTVPRPPPTPVPAGSRQGAAGQTAANGAPAPAPTPYGFGAVFAAPPASASTTPPSDSNTGYLPGVSSPDNQPKPPQR
ncbi:MAG TPA: FxLYD domain-containing protein [Thermoanaerobaculia bacterium]|nr:FxLYD domain-containing protein [Thermoanaerobaculia bacterium]